MTVPGIDPIEASAGGTYAKAFEILNSKYITTGNWAMWATTLLEEKLDSMNTAAADFNIDALVAAAVASINAIPTYIPGNIADYVAPTAPTYETVPAYVAPSSLSLAALPAYVAPTLGTLLTTLPTLSDITMPSAPSATISYTPTAFIDVFHTAFAAKLTTDMGSGSTGLGSAESAMFARETARVTAMRAAAYSELTTMYSNANFDMPDGALLAKQTEVNNESSLRLTDSSAAILSESARLAVQYNIAVLQISQQFDATLVQIWNSSEERKFNKAREDVIQAVIVFSETIKGALGAIQVDIAKMQATMAINDNTVKVFEAQLAGQIEPIKAVASANLAEVQQYTAEVQAALAPIEGLVKVNMSKAEIYKADIAGATAAVQAGIAVEAAEGTAYQVSAQKATTIAELTGKQVQGQIEAAVRQYATTIAALSGASNAAAQMVASALNGVTVSSSFGWSGNSSYNTSEDANAARTNDVHQTQAL